jgi:membrane protein implicated in regulation of membrane protease activity
MNENAELLLRLRDAHAPDAPPWWPPAPGWWLALLLLLALAVLAVRLLRPHWQRYRLRRRLLAALEAASSAGEIARVLRAAALARFPAHGVAGLQGAEWIAFLESRDRARGRFAALGDALTAMPYRAPRADDDVAALRAAARGWLRAAV